MTKYPYLLLIGYIAFIPFATTINGKTKSFDCVVLDNQPPNTITCPASIIGKNPYTDPPVVLPVGTP